MATTLNTKNKIHPHKMYLYAGLGSIVMMFAGLTSAYIVKKSQANWLDFEHLKYSLLRPWLFY